MATYIANDLLTRAAIVLQDVANVRWTVSELLGWLNDGQRELVRIKPNAYVLTVPVQLSVGAKQSLPADGISLIDIPCNMGSSGATPGRVIRQVDRRILDAQVPSWPAMTPVNDVLHYCYTPLDIKVFYVYPPSAGNYVEMQYLAIPADITDVNSTITLDDVYAAPLLDYILYRAYQKDADYSQNEGLSQVHGQAFNNALQAKVAAEQMANGFAKAGQK